MSRLIGAASDITLVLNSDGIILDIAFQNRQMLETLNACANWVGQTFHAIAAPDSRAKTAALLQDAVQHRESKWRHINHRTKNGHSIPILYCCVEISGSDHVMAFGRDLRAVSALQQRLVNMQQSLEGDYARQRNIEACYRLLSEWSSDAVLILDPIKGRIIEANAAASALCGLSTIALSGHPLMEVLDTGSLAGVQAQIRSILAGSQVAELPILLTHNARAVTLRMARFMQEGTTLVLIFMVPMLRVTSVLTMPDHKMLLLRIVENMPDAFVVTDEEGDVITANAAFLEMVDILHEREIVGQSLDRWVGATGVDMSVMIANLRSRGLLRFFNTTVHGEQGISTQVEISAAVDLGSDHPAIGFTIRSIGLRLNLGLQAQNGSARLPDEQLSRPVKQLTELVGRVSLKDLVQESTEVIEQLAIKAALELTNDNRASAAEMLGLSRQSFYAKLHRYGIGDLVVASSA